MSPTRSTTTSAHAARERGSGGPRRASTVNRSAAGTSSRTVTPWRSSTRPLGARAVVEVNDAVGKPALVEQFELQADIIGEGSLPSPDQHCSEEEVELVDQPGPDRLPGELGTPDTDVPVRRRLQLADRIDVEVVFDARPGARYLGQRLRVDDLVGRAPDLRVVPDDRRLVGEGISGLPVGHHLVHATPVEMGPDRPLEIVDEEVHLLARLGPAEV